MSRFVSEIKAAIRPFKLKLTKHIRRRRRNETKLAITKDARLAAYARFDGPGDRNCNRWCGKSAEIVYNVWVWREAIL